MLWLPRRFLVSLLFEDKEYVYIREVRNLGDRFERMPWPRGMEARQFWTILITVSCYRIIDTFFGMHTL